MAAHVLEADMHPCNNYIVLPDRIVIKQLWDFIFNCCLFCENVQQRDLQKHWNSPYVHLKG